MCILFSSSSVRKDALTEAELEYYAEHLSEIGSVGEADESEPYSSDDSVKDQNFITSCASGSDDENNYMQSVEEENLPYSGTAF
ncbi:unnamed protein product [Acanthoscelides obtectus]|uniref:Uncharacterized protein n=1 Tax=Acanthoscelides obtectus TaxID=200917 RepID=A0A9P0NZR9_ACAOB|nr:unnamed protein product [Acanthoscelides obtectus]CAK1657051.1 hypothetical protein AOBTE_LOCUS20087 [Acanthoscelides obtectus]